jgi:hypothetical protein
MRVTLNMNIVISALLVALSVVACNSSPAITKKQALRRVEEKAKELQIPIDSRSPKIETNDTTFRITYPLPSNMRGGDWIFVVDRNTGDFADIKIHR